MITSLVIVFIVSVIARYAGLRGPAGILNGKLQAIPNKRSCVSSDALGSRRYVDPFPVLDSGLNAWRAIERIVESMPRATIVTREDDYLHAEVKTPVFPFIGDLELHLRPEESMIAVRSVSRVGNLDLGLNRRRVESIRGKLAARTSDVLR